MQPGGGRPQLPRETGPAPAGSFLAAPTAHRAARSDLCYTAGARRGSSGSRPARNRHHGGGHPSRCETVVAEAATHSHWPRLRLGWREKAYFITHGVHHFFPNDSLRLVMVPGVSIPLATAFLFAFLAIFGSVLGATFFAGFVMGYLMYDTTHYVVHHHACRGRISAFLKKWHMRHHYVNPDRDYGVSSPAWDFVWGTWGTKKN